jgi:hypothetical protein
MLLHLPPVLLAVAIKRSIRLVEQQLLLQHHCFAFTYAVMFVDSVSRQCCWVSRQSRLLLMLAVIFGTKLAEKRS